MKVTTSDILKKLADDCWTIDIWSEHPADKDVYFTAKICCGVGARGRVKYDAKNIDEAVKMCYEFIVKKWGIT